MIESFDAGRDKLSNPDFSELMERVSFGLLAYQPGNYLLTDDKAPVEVLGMQVIDDLIEDEIEYYKNIFQKDGIKCLLNGM